MAKRNDYQDSSNYEAAQDKRREEIRQWAKDSVAEADAALYPNPNPGTRPADGDVTEQPNAEQVLVDATPAEQEEAVEKAAEREAEVHPIEEAEKEQEEEAEKIEEAAPKAEVKKETAAQKKAREAKEAAAKDDK